LNSDAAVYGGGNIGNLGGVLATEDECHGQPCSAEFTLPPLRIIVFKPERMDWKPKPKLVEPEKGVAGENVEKKAHA
jgi:hypothetical protein